MLVYLETGHGACLKLAKSVESAQRQALIRRFQDHAKAEKTQQETHKAFIALYYKILATL